MGAGWWSAQLDLRKFNKLNKWIKIILFVICYLLLQIFGVLDYLNVIISFLTDHKIYLFIYTFTGLSCGFIYFCFCIYLIMDLRIKGTLNISKKYPKFVHNYFNDKLEISQNKALYEAYKQMYFHFACWYLVTIILSILLYIFY